MTERGRYIVFEGGDGVGKSTAMRLTAERTFESTGRKFITIEEPDGAHDMAGNLLVPISSEIRKIIKAKEYGRSALTNVLLFNASRRENDTQAIQPALERGDNAYSARNWRSTDAYQGGGQGLSSELIERMVRESTSKSYMTPDNTFILDLDEDERQRRIAKREGRPDLDTFESLPSDFHVAVANRYRAIAKAANIPIIDASRQPDEVVDEVLWHINNHA